MAAKLTVFRAGKRETGSGLGARRHPRRPVVCPIPIRRPIVLAQFVADVLDAAKNGEDLAAGATILGPKLTGEAFSIAEAPIDDQPSQP